MGKDWKNSKSGKIDHSQSFGTTSVGKDGKVVNQGEIGHSE